MTGMRAIATGLFLPLILIPTSAAAWGLVVLDPIADNAACVQVTQHTVQVEVEGLTGAYSDSLTFQVDADRTATIVHSIDSDETGDAVWLDGQPLSLSWQQGEAALDRLTALAARRSTPRLLAAMGTNVAFAEVTLTAGQHELRTVGAPFIDRSGATPHVVQRIRHLGTACTTPATTVTMTIRDADPIGAVFTPYHDRIVQKVDVHNAEVVVQAPAHQQAHDVHLFLATSDKAIAADAFTYRAAQCDAEAPGYLMVAAGTTVIDAEEAVAKNIALVIDTSGSMQGEKLEQVRRALFSILENLQPEDRFELVTFSSNARALFGQLAGASDAGRIEEARRLVGSLSASGSTNINDALMLAMTELSNTPGDSPSMVLFLTDGQATAGTTDSNAIVANVVAANEIGARVFSFGVGDSVNTRLLDELGRQTGGSTSYIRPGSDIDPVLQDFYRQVQAPVATNLALVADGFTTSDPFPDALSDMFVGTQCFMLARYSDSSQARLTLNASTEAGPASFDVRGPIVRNGTKHAYLPRLWASRLLGKLLYDARQNGGEEQTVNQVRALAQAHGFVTPWTPFNVDERGEVSMGYHNPTERESGSEAVGTSSYTNELSGNSNAGAYSAGEGTAPIRQAHDRTFVRRKGVWVDTRVDEERAKDPTATEVRFLGPGWHRMAWASPTMREILSTGRSVTFEWGCTVVRVVDPADTEGYMPREDPVLDALLTAEAGEDVDLAPRRTPPPAQPNNNGKQTVDNDELGKVEASCQNIPGPSSAWLLLLIAAGYLMMRASTIRR